MINELRLENIKLKTDYNMMKADYAQMEQLIQQVSKPDRVADLDRLKSQSSQQLIGTIKKLKA